MTARTQGATASAAQTSLSRRTFFKAASLGAMGMGLGRLGAAAGGQREPDRSERACIMIFNVGGPSHLDTFDMKPAAPREIRGPFREIQTCAPEIRISELFPRHAQVADKFALVRSCSHRGPAVHDAGWQLMQTGRFFLGGLQTPHAGAVAAYLLPPRHGMPAHLLLPAPMGRGGGNLPHGQAGGFLGSAYDPHVADPMFSLRQEREVRLREAQDLSREPPAIRERYGRHRFGRCCLLARRLVERGTRFVTINTFHTVFDEIGWDIHGRQPFATFAEMQRFVAPMYDQGYAALVEDLDRRGLLATTLVCNLCEFGRTPRINPDGGRDHWPQCFTVYFAGGGVRGGQVIGRSDAIGGAPEERPVEPAAIVATIFAALGLDLKTQLPGPGGQRYPLVDAEASPLAELFG